MNTKDGDKIILSHYQKIAKNFGLKPTSSMRDPVIREREVRFFLEEIQSFALERKNPHLKILDLGCGNGHLLSVLTSTFPEFELSGLEFTPELFQLAQSRNLPNVRLLHGDCRKIHFQNDSFDIIITERVIINLLSWESQKQALTNIHQYLKVGGLYLMSESFKEPWTNLNRARHESALDQIPQSPHNRYLTAKSTQFIESLGLRQEHTNRKMNDLSSHFFFSRILHPLLRPHQKRTLDTQMSQFFNELSESPRGDYSPILFKRFRKFS